ncbi:MAG TPA: nucleotidyltransferase family protein [Syntrophales bacterium]|nr:nucleotidyltransferase family protein [Syntrophales bacterium]
MGTVKQLLPVHDRPAVVRCVENIRGSKIADVVVVVSPAGSEIIEALSGLPVAITVNALLGSDMAASVRTGLNAVDPFSTGIFICLCDYPLVTSATLSAMGILHNDVPDQIIIPMFQGRKGHPTLFPHFVLADLEGVATLRDILSLHKERILFFDVADEGTVLDMDTPEDYQKILERCRP